MFHLVRPFWAQYEAMGISEPTLRANEKVERINLSNYMNNLVNNSIGNEGCQFLSMGKWPNLQYLYLGNYMNNLD